jgi:hypothetical protein
LQVLVLLQVLPPEQVCVRHVAPPLQVVPPWQVCEPPQVGYPPHV